MKKLLKSFIFLLCFILIIANGKTTTSADFKNLEQNVTITENADSESGLSFTTMEFEVNVGSRLQLARYLRGNQDNLDWHTSNPSLASVTNGAVAGVKAGTVSITVTNAAGETAECTVRILFTDVPASGKYYSDPVYWAVENAITNGYKDNDGLARTFKPQNNCTREAVVTFLWRMAGKPEPQTTVSKFKDVQNKSAYYYKAVLWAAEKGITAGYKDGTFKPNATCLREHVVTFLWRYDGKPAALSETNPFNDIRTSDYYYTASLWANENGIAKGYSSGKNKGGFGPKLDCLREHVVTFLYRYANPVRDSILRNFKADEIAFFANEDATITFTVESDNADSSIELFNTVDHYVGDMHDDGVDGDETADDGIYSFQTQLNKPAGSIDYYAKSQGIVSNVETIGFYDHPTEEAREEGETIQANLDEIDSKYADEDGYVPADSVDAAVSEAADYAAQLLQQGMIKDYEVTECSVVFRLNSGLTILYAPRIEGTYNSGDDSTLTIYTFQPLYDWVYSLTDRYIPLPAGVDNEANLISAAARKLTGEFDRCVYTSATATRNVDIALSDIKNIGKNQIVLWQGHGDWAGDEIHSVLLTNAEFDWNAWFWDPFYFIDCCANRIVKTGKYESVSSKFIDKYGKDMSNTYIYLGPCESGHDSVLANSFLNKGAAAVIGNTHSVLCLYGDMMEYTTTKLLSEINPATENYYTLGEALSRAKQLYGTSDYQYRNSHSEPAAEPVLFGGRNAYGYRIADAATGTLSGRVCNAADRVTPISEAQIDIYRNDAKLKTIYTDSSGNYSIELPTGEYRVVTSASGYVSFTAYADINNNRTTYMETFLMIEGTEDQYGTATGIITNALTGSSIADVHMEVRKGWNNTSGEIVAGTVTDSEGRYTLSMPIGNYTLTAMKTGYISNTLNVIVQNGSEYSQDGTLTPVIAGDSFRAVLTWGENPSDLDSHVEGILSNNSYFHVYYSNKSAYDGDVEVCNLDVDDTTSYGPETTTINPTTEHPYYYYVYRYAGSGTVAASNAQVKIYQGDNLITTLNVPVDQGSGDYWNVFAIVNGRIVIKNTITSSKDVTYMSNSDEVSITLEQGDSLNEALEPKTYTDSDPESGE